MTPRAIPRAAGIGLRTAHMPAFAAEPASAALTTPWLEIHSENFLAPGGPRLAMLDAIAARYPISCHGVGLSLGSAEGLDRAHLQRLSTLFARVRPGLLSEHLAWSVTNGTYLNDLLPLPYTAETIEVLCRNVGDAQDAFGRQLLVENPSAYVNFPASTLAEPAFLNALVARTGCGLLLDINNVFVTCSNVGGDPARYLDDIDAAAVGEIHLAGHSTRGEGAETVLVDTHSRKVCDAVWALYERTVARIGLRPTLIEWDLEIPELPVLLDEAAQAQSVLDGLSSRVADVA